MNYCYSTLQPMKGEGYSQSARKALQGGSARKFPHILSFTHADLLLPINERKGRHLSISGVQDKVQLDWEGGALTVVEKGGSYILKPQPSSPYLQLREDVPANEHLTMQIAGQIFGINVAVNACIRFSDGELAYITRRFDRREGVPILQEDLCQLMERTEETHGSEYKYDASYEEIVETVMRICPAYKVELRKIFFRILFNYVFANGDAHLKNFSFCQSAHGDYVLSPAYDLLNTALHTPNELGRTALDLFADNYMTPEYEERGFYTEPDFVRLGGIYGVDERTVLKMIALFHERRELVEELVQRSFLSEEAKVRYLEIYRDRLLAFHETCRWMR